MSDWIDISIPLREDMPTWPGDAGYRIRQTKSIKAGDSNNLSMITCDVHVGTHIDAPKHFIDKGKTIEKIQLDELIGPVYVGYLPDADKITVDDLEDLEIPDDVQRILIRTNNSLLWEQGVKEFREDFVALTNDAAEWIVKKGIKLIGLDYLSVQIYGDDPKTHVTLLEAEVILVEGLNLSGVKTGIYDLICLPICIEGSEGAMARVVIRPKKG